MEAVKNENIVAAWKEKREKAAYPDQEMAGRLLVYEDIVLAVTDSGRVLHSEPFFIKVDANYDALQGVKSIYQSNRFILKDGSFVDGKGQPVPERKNYWQIDQDGRVCINTGLSLTEDRLHIQRIGGAEAFRVIGRAQAGEIEEEYYPLKCWYHPMAELEYYRIGKSALANAGCLGLAMQLGFCTSESTGVNVMFGLTYKGEIACHDPEMLVLLHRLYPTFEMNPNMTLGKDIVACCLGGNNALFVLKASGELNSYMPGMKEKQICSRKNIVYFDTYSSGNDLFAIDESGNLFAWQYGNIAATNDVLMSECVVAHGNSGSIWAMNKDKQLKMVRRSSKISGMRCRKVESWNIRDTK